MSSNSTPGDAAHTPSLQNARQSLGAHVADKGHDVYLKYGPNIGWEELQNLLQDRTCVRYPCEIVFDKEQLRPGEFAYPAPKGSQPQEGYIVYVHPHFADQLDQVSLLVLYQLVAVNYGPFASAEDAEVFGAAALGLEREVYYQRLCTLADQLS